MTRPEMHPVSRFELDVHWSSGRPAEATIEAHVLACGACQRYLAHLDRIAAEPAPSWNPRGERSAGGPRAAPWRTWLALSGTAAAVAFGTLIYLRARPAAQWGDPGAYVGVKGSPAVQVLVRTSAGTSVWDGRAPVHPGDALALEVAFEGVERVAVAAPSPHGGAWTRLAEAECVRAPLLLPFTLVIDEQPEDERVAIVFSAERIDDGDLTAAIEGEARTRDVWVAGFVLHKSIVKP
ncbi:MAG: hypothetical protein ACMG6S_06945 [Byssovorax sp.]